MSRPDAAYSSTRREAYRCGKGVDSGRREQKEGEDGKAVRPEAIAKRPRGEAAEKGEGGQNPGRKPSLRRNADGYSVGHKRHCVGEPKNESRVARTTRGGAPASSR